MTWLGPYVRGGSRVGGLVYYSAGVASISAFGTTVFLPHQGVLWLVGRLMLDAAGGLFGFYLIIAVVLSVAGGAVQLRDRSAAPDLPAQK